MVVQNLRLSAAELHDKTKPGLEFLDQRPVKYSKGVVPDDNSCLAWQGGYIAFQELNRRQSFEITSDVLAAFK